MVQRVVDLRSDTLTLPTDAMRDAMYKAELGDDVYGEDPTVKALEELAAAKVGMEAALFVPSGTMGNTCALLAHTTPGDEVIFEELAHMYNWECGIYANVGGLAARPVRGQDGIVSPDDLSALIRSANVHFSPTSLLCLENTHNNAAGSCWTPAEIEAVAAVAHQHKIKVHIDGARIFNAAVALGVPASDFTRGADSLMFCISKGLSAPVGSLLCGSRAFIEEAYRMRKRLGGAMRQAGVLAAAGIVALEEMVDRLAEDHQNSLRLADGLEAVKGVEVDRAARPTNIFRIDVEGLGLTTAQLIERYRQVGILCNPRPPHGARLVTHRHIGADDVDYVVAATQDLAKASA